MSNIHPITDGLLKGEQKEQALKQRAKVIWMVGLSGSGKSTLAKSLEKELFARGYYTMLLDGDNLRTGINKNLGFSNEDRVENIRRAAEVSRLFAENGTITICSLISPTKEVREMASQILRDKYVEVYIKCPLEVCEERDVKGLYKKARKGLIKDFTGIGSVFEEPEAPDLLINTHLETEEESLKHLVDYIVPLVKY
ncbi:MAG: adenylyl-sulfate kinase [Cyclobacteriaceae bacterium]|nr:adenylyl-sulfate kinase [Cyclobacteriaceae bacterium]